MRTAVQKDIKLTDVARIVYNRVVKAGKPPAIQVTYYCGPKALDRYKETLCFDHAGYAAKKARQWWQSREIGVPPKSTDEALAKIRNLAVPKQIRVDVAGKYPEVVGYLF